MAEIEQPLSTPSNQPIPNPPLPLGPGSMRRLAGGGFSWLTISLIAGRALGVIAQLILGRILSEADFGVFAVVVSIATLVRVFADGGVPQVLVQRGEEDFRRLTGPGFWLSAVSSFTVGLLLAIAAPVIAWFYDDPQLTLLLLIVAAALPLTAPAAMMRAKLRINFEFRTLALIAFGWVAIRHIASVSFAALGLGVMSLVLPLLLSVCFEGIVAFWVTRFKPWLQRPQIKAWPEIMRSSLWVVLASGCRGLTRTGDYLVLGMLTSQSTVGQYYFGYLITTQIVEMLASNLQQVAFPIMSKLANEPERQSRAIIRTIRMLVFVAAPTSLALACIVRPTIEFLDATIWNGKWTDAIPLMQILAIAAPVRMFTEVLNAALSSRGRFGAAARLMLLEGLLLMAAAALAVSLVGDQLTGIAAVIAVSQAVFSMGAGAWTLREFGISPSTFFTAFLPSWLIAIACGAFALVATLPLNEGASPFVIIALRLAAYAIAFGALAKLLLASEISDLMSSLPSTFTDRFLRRPTNQ